MLIAKPSSDSGIVPPPSDDSLVDDMSPGTLPGAMHLPHICFVALRAWSVLAGDASIEIAGGAEVQQCILARLLARAGYRVS